MDRCKNEPNHSSTAPLREPSGRSYWWVLPALLLCMVPLCFLGYGSDNDSYGVVESGISTWKLHVLSTSRNPGYWTYEAIDYVLSALGGYLLSNLMSLFVASAIVWRFYKLALRLDIRYPLLVSACLAVTPIFVIASTSTMDYVWSFLCIVLTAEMLFADRLVMASLLAALAISLRGSNSVVVAGGFASAIAYEIYTRQRVTSLTIKLAVSGIAAALLGLITYILSYQLAGDSMSFLVPRIGPAPMWPMKMRLGRFFYKGSYALGPAADIVCVIAAYFYLKNRGQSATSIIDFAPRLLAICSGFFLGDVILFLKFPVEISYLIPAIFFFLLLTGATFFRFSRPLAIALFISILSLNIVRPEFAQPNVVGHATSANLHLALTPGMLIQDVRLRRLVIACRDTNCWNRRANLLHQ